MREINMALPILIRQPYNAVLVTAINLFVGVYCVTIFTQTTHGNNIIYNVKRNLRPKTIVTIIAINAPLVISFFVVYNILCL